MKRKAGITFLLGLWLTSIGGNAFTAPQEKTRENPLLATPHDRGLAHFNRGFFDFLPKNLKAEAAQEFELAAREFKQALELEPGRAQTHRSLARVYHLQEKFLPAAQHYQKAAELAPHDVDAYVLAADSFAEAKCFDEAGLMLQRAKTMTADPKALRTLDRLMLKLDEAERQAERER